MRNKGCFTLFFLLLAVTRAQADSPLSDAQLLSLASAHNAGDYRYLPLGDRHYTLDLPRKGYIYMCQLPRGEDGSAGLAGPWIRGDKWDAQEKISVSGDQSWPNATFEMSASGTQRIFSGNGLPISHSTGFFPVQPSDPAFTYDRNPNRIQAQSYGDKIARDPAYSETPFCMGMEVGVMLSGVQLLNGFDANLRDAAAHEVQDKCNGHPQKNGLYHYHSLSACLKDNDVHQVIGYALDGFPITGGQVAPGKFLMTQDLDVCHGITSAIRQDGVEKMTYHYVMTPDFPYSVSCFRAKPSRTGPPHGTSSQPTRNADMSDHLYPVNDTWPPRQSPSPIPASAMGGDGHHPPAEAIRACAGQPVAGVCGFTSPRGDSISGQCLQAPDGTIACVPPGMRP